MHLQAETTPRTDPVGDQPRPPAGHLRADRVNVRFPGQGDGRPVTALQDVTLDIPQGQFISLVGASGCGKTTLLNLFAGLLQPSTGTVRLGDREPRSDDPDVGYMFARDALLPWRTARRNVELGLESAGMSAAARKARSVDLLDMVGLGEFTSSYPRQLSQGMRQRAALARTLAPDPSVMLMDEPFAALDAQTKLRLQFQFLRIWEDAPPDERKTVLFVTHDLQEALLLADRVIVMLPRPGRIATDRIIDLPRPRVHDLTSIMFSTQFRELHEELFHLLEGDLDADPDV